MPLLPLFPRVVHRGLPLHRAGIFLPGILTRPRCHRTVRIAGVHRWGVARVLRRMRPPLRCGTGRGSIVMRARHEIEEGKGERRSIVLTAIPYQVGKSGLVEKLAEAAKD